MFVCVLTVQSFSTAVAEILKFGESHWMLWEQRPHSESSNCLATRQPHQTILSIDHSLCTAVDVAHKFGLQVKLPYPVDPDHTRQILPDQSRLTRIIIPADRCLPYNIAGNFGEYYKYVWNSSQAVLEKLK